jgi:trans-AT polyketide synthase/acyltransferase/oxidoreductase domain-containing protein
MLSRTEYTQPALFVVNAMIYRDATERTGLAPQYLMGHSLGEVNALQAAGAFDFETGVRIVQKRAEFMGRCGEGAMVALLGERERLLTILQEHGRDVHLANDNSPAQIVVSGRRNAIEGFTRQMRDLAVCEAVPLPVSGAFHSPMMASAREAFGEFLERLSFGSLLVPVVANVTAQPYESASLRRLMAHALTGPVRWLDSVEYVFARGPLLLQTIEPGNALTSLIRQIALRPRACSTQ